MQMPVGLRRVPGQVPGKVQVQVFGEVLEGFGADTVPCAGLEGSDADTW